MIRAVAVGFAFAALLPLVVARASHDDGPPPTGCRPPDSRTLAATRQARVFRLDDLRTYACLYSRDEPVRIGREEVERPIRFAGRFVAYAFRDLGDEDVRAFTDMRVIDLVSGRRRRACAFFSRVYGCAEDAQLHRVLLRRTGGVAWVSESWISPTSETRKRQLWRLDARGRSRLAYGGHIRRMRFCAQGRICWEQRGETRSASLH
jgi:hypothetical protein